MNDIKTWPSSGEAKNELERLSLTHRILPLPVFDTNHNPVGPAKVNGVLRNSIVEIQFNVKHHAIRSEGVAKFDTYTAFIRQIVVIKKAPPKAPDPYRRTLRNGPVVFTAKSVSVALPSPPAEQERASMVVQTQGKAEKRVHGDDEAVEDGHEGPPTLISLHPDAALGMEPILLPGEEEDIPGERDNTRGDNGAPPEPKDNGSGEPSDETLAGKDRQSVKRRGASLEQAAKRVKKPSAAT